MAGVSDANEVPAKQTAYIDSFDRAPRGKCVRASGLGDDSAEESLRPHQDDGSGPEQSS